MKQLRLIVLGTLASSPYAGMAWMHMQLTAGLRRLGHDARFNRTANTTSCPLACPHWLRYIIHK